VAVAAVGVKIVAQYALMRLPLSYQGSVIDGAISTATVTDKRHRGKGLFTQLAETLYENVEKDGCKIVFGFPNSQSIHGFTTRLGWFEVNDFPLHLKIIDFFPFVKKYIGSRLIAGVFSTLLSFTVKVVFQKFADYGYEIKLTPTGTLPAGIDEPWKESESLNRIGVVRNEKYLSWRYFEKPFYDYDFYVVSHGGQLCGYFVLYLGEKFGLRTIYIMECVVTKENPSAYKAILHKLENIARERQADSISVLLLPNHPQYKLFKQSGFIRVPRKLLPQKIYFAAKVLSKDIDASYVKDAKNWYISWGDLDVV
jgi:hypothetical protein